MSMQKNLGFLNLNLVPTRLIKEASGIVWVVVNLHLLTINNFLQVKWLLELL